MNFNLPDYPSLYYLIPLGIVSFLVLFFAFLGLSLIFIKLLSKAYSTKEKEREKHLQAEEELEAARKEALDIIANANEEAGKILEDANKLGQTMASDFDSKVASAAEDKLQFLNESSENLLRVYRKAMMEASKGNIHSINDLSHSFKEELDNGIREFREKIADNHSQMLQKVEREADEYRKSRFENIDEEFYEVLSDVMEKVIGKVMSLEEHEEYIVRTLEDARKKGTFNSEY